MPTSDLIYVYLQQPGTETWVTVGRYAHRDGRGYFQFSPRYMEQATTWVFDPVNLPFSVSVVEAHRYGGLHDVLRDGCPDDWGRTLLRRQYNLPDNTPEWQYLLLSTNADRWGALAFGTAKKPPVAHAGQPKLNQLGQLVDELRALSEQRPAVHPALRRRLLQTPSVGGARPKATIRDGSSYWLVKPWVQTDIEDIPALEHATHVWGRAAGLNLAETVLHPLHAGQSVVRVRRFDREGSYRHMVLSGASLMQLEFPVRALQSLPQAAQLSYGHLATQLRVSLGVPAEDLHELFGRMVFNWVVGNDDDHPRNHAALYSAAEKRWRLSPGFDVVPNPMETPMRLHLQPGTHVSAYTRDGLLIASKQFGFRTDAAAEAYLDALLHRLGSSFEQVRLQYPVAWRPVIERRLAERLRSLVAIR